MKSSNDIPASLPARLVHIAPFIALVADWRQKLLVLETVPGTADQRSLIANHCQALETALQAARTLEDDLTPTEVARLHKVTAAAITHRCRAGHFPGARRVGGQWRIPASEVGGAPAPVRSPGRRSRRRA
jgi:hypothetical protein